MRFRRAWHLFCAEVHRGLAWFRDWRAEHNTERSRMHAGKAREHDQRANVCEREPTELDGGADRPLRPFDQFTETEEREK